MIQTCHGERLPNEQLASVVDKRLDCSITFSYCLAHLALSFETSKRGEVICLLQPDYKRAPVVHGKIYQDLYDAGVDHIYQYVPRSSR